MNEAGATVPRDSADSKTSEWIVAGEQGKLADPMKLTLISFFTVVLFFQSGCATRPSIDEQSLQEQQNDQAAKRSDAFAKNLPQ